jgi:flagellar hook protein FlgE
MLRSLYSAISGLRSHQQMMDVTGNNIANVSTAGFKGSQTVFQDTLSQMLKAANAPQGAIGGTNPAQIGLGVRLGGVQTTFSQGSAQTTGRSTDMMINGDGMFIVNDDGEQMYTRSGSFSFDANGTLVDTNGSQVMGWMATNGVVDPTGPLTQLSLPNDPTLEGFRITPDGTITGVYKDGTKQPIGQIGLATFPNPQGLEKAGDTRYRTTLNSGTPSIGEANTGMRGDLTVGALEMSNVDLAQEFTNLIIAERGFQANSKVISTSDELLQDLVNMKR